MKVERTPTGKPQVPKTISTMSDDQYDAWCRHLSSDDLDYLERFTFDWVEYSVSYIDECGDIVDSPTCTNTLDEAMSELARLVDDEHHTWVIERRTHTHAVIDQRKRLDTDHQVMHTCGNRDWLLAGGWIAEDAEAAA
jgi:hypothetical protein